MPPNILLFYCSNLWALTTSALKFLPGLFLRPKIPPRLLLAPQRGILHTSKCVSHFPNRQAGRPVKKHLYTSKRAPFPPRLLLTPKIAKGGYLYTPQIKFWRILNNSRFGRLCTVFLHSRHSAFLQIAPISRRSASALGLFSANGPDWPTTAPPIIKNAQTRLCRFLPGQQIAPVFCALYFSGTNQAFCKIAPIFTFFICLHAPQF